MSLFKSKYFYKFSRNPLSVFGLIVVTMIILLAIFDPFITPFPEHVGPFTDFANKSKPPDSTYIFGTDKIGRDIFTRVIYGYRISLILGVVDSMPIKSLARVPELPKFNSVIFFASKDPRPFP